MFAGLVASNIDYAACYICVNIWFSDSNIDMSCVSDLSRSPYVCLINAKRRKAILEYSVFALLFCAEMCVVLIPLLRILTECIMKQASVGHTSLRKTDGRGEEGGRKKESKTKGR
jgi:hypothetical protein